MLFMSRNGNDKTEGNLEAVRNTSLDVINLLIEINKAKNIFLIGNQNIIRNNKLLFLPPQKKEIIV